MKIDEYIKDFVEREKEIHYNPFLATCVMEQLEQQKHPAKQENNVWKTIVVAASFLVVIFLGLNIGNYYQNISSHQVSLNINDSQIENLGYYNFTENEE